MKQSQEGKLADGLREEIRKRPQDFVQPWCYFDRMNGNRLRVNDEYFSIYGVNPHNKLPQNKHDPFVERLNEEQAYQEYKNSPAYGQASNEELKKDIVERVYKQYWENIRERNALDALSAIFWVGKEQADDLCQRYSGVIRMATHYSSVSKYEALYSYLCSVRGGKR